MLAHELDEHYVGGGQAFNANVHFNRNHHPLSDLFVVLNEQEISGPVAPATRFRVTVKVTRMVSMEHERDPVSSRAIPISRKCLNARGE